MDFLSVLTCIRKDLDQTPSGQIGVNVKICKSRYSGAGDGKASDGLAVVGEKVTVDQAVNDAASLAEGPHWL